MISIAREARVRIDTSASAGAGMLSSSMSASAHVSLRASPVVGSLLLGTFIASGRAIA